jgi:hypothetical protein
VLVLVLVLVLVAVLVQVLVLVTVLLLILNLQLAWKLSLARWWTLLGREVSVDQDLIARFRYWRDRFALLGSGCMLRCRVSLLSNSHSFRLSVLDCEMLSVFRGIVRV